MSKNLKEIYEYVRDGNKCKMMVTDMDQIIIYEDQYEVGMKQADKEKFLSEAEDALLAKLEEHYTNVFPY
jgi:hypothetical protein